MEITTAHAPKHHPRFFRSGVAPLLLLLAGVAGGCESSPARQTATPCATDADCAAKEGSFCDDGACTVKHCTSDVDCASHGGACVEGSCATACSSHFDCAPGGLCKAAPTPYCVAGEPAKDGQFYQHCPLGAEECDRDAGFICLGGGVGDIDAYCSTDCKQDSDCPTGFRCGALGVTPCGNACGVGGRNVPGCAPTAEIGAGKRYQCAQPLGVVQHVCQLRRFCDPCETDDDCLGTPGQICARDQSGEKICTQLCDPSIDSCPWGDASVCDQFDAERAGYTCAHRFGACHGQGKACDPCRDGDDCAPTGFCQTAQFTGEQFCVDLSVACDCGDDADSGGLCPGHGCPDSPGGLPTTCASGPNYDDTIIGHRCFGASSSADASSPRTGCWPAH